VCRTLSYAICGSPICSLSIGAATGAKVSGVNPNLQVVRMGFDINSANYDGQTSLHLM
jgi:hypothetical protein